MTLLLTVTHLAAAGLGALLMLAGLLAWACRDARPDVDEGAGERNDRG